MKRSIPPLALTLLIAAGCGAADDRAGRAADGRTSQAPSACPPDSAASSVAMDTTDFWHVYLDGRRVLEAPSFEPPEPLTMTALRQARGICIRYFTDAGAEDGARIAAAAVGARGRREIASRTIHDGQAEFGVPELVEGLEAAESLVFRIAFPDRPQGPWSEPRDLLGIGPAR